MEAWGLTDTGNVREENQDFYRMERLGPETLLAVVCDGMGGARAGNVASRLACEVFCGEVCRSLRDGMTEAEEQDVLCTAAKLANISVYEHAQLSEEFRGMGTTLVAALVRGLRVEIVNIGDSRAYHLGADGIRCVTVDHSLVELMVQRGELTHEQAKNHPSKNPRGRHGKAGRRRCVLPHGGAGRLPAAVLGRPFEPDGRSGDLI